MTTTFLKYLDKIEIGSAQSYTNMVVVPLAVEEESTLNYITLKEALEGQLVRITEVGTGGIGTRYPGRR